MDACLSPVAVGSLLPPVAGIINSGGVIVDSVVSNQSAASVQAVFAPKLVSAMAMQHEAVTLPVSQTILFSSVASLVGTAGQTNYAAANAALEGWMQAASVQGVNGVTVQWGAWAIGKSFTF